MVKARTWYGRLRSKEEIEELERQEAGYLIL
jgi:hypothetical protein